MSKVAMRGTLDIGPYKGYFGCAEYDTEEEVFGGEVLWTKDVITFVASDPRELINAFQESIDDYLSFCASRGEKPDKPFSGKFLVRTTPELHKKLSMRASQCDVSLNQLVVQTLEKSVNLSFLFTTEFFAHFDERYQVQDILRTPTVSPVTAKITGEQFSIMEHTWNEPYAIAGTR